MNQIARLSLVDGADASTIPSFFMSHFNAVVSRITLPDGLLIGEFAVLPSSASRVL